MPTTFRPYDPDQRPATVLADAGCCNEADLATLEARGVDGHVALGPEGRRTAVKDAEKHPSTARMAAKLATAAGRAQYAERKWLSEAPHGWIKESLGFRRYQPALPGEAASRGGQALHPPDVQRQAHEVPLALHLLQAASSVGSYPLHPGDSAHLRMRPARNNFKPTPQAIECVMQPGSPLPASPFPPKIPAC